MKKILSIMSMLLLAVLGARGQAPGIFNYQGVARNSVGNVLVNKNITLRLTVHDGSAAGPVVYQESRAVITNPFGLFNVQVGSPGATAVTGTIAAVNWGVGNKYIQVEIDPNGGTTFINIGTAQMASVPYALYTNLAGDLVLPFDKTQADAGTLFRITNSGTGAASTALEGRTNSTASNVSAIIGTVTPTGPGGFSSGVRGINNGTGGLGIGVWGSQNGSGWGVYGQTPGGIGVHGASTTGFGVYGQSSSGTGIYGFSSSGRSGFFENTNAANNQPTLSVASNGTGWAGQFSSTNATTRALRTVGGLQLTGINEALNRILASDATGNASWQDPSAVGIVTGSGTLNFVPKWTPNGTNLGNSQMFDDGTNTGIGTTVPLYKLQIQTTGGDDGLMLRTSNSNNIRLRLANQTNTKEYSMLVGGTGSGFGSGAFVLTDVNSGDAMRMLINGTTGNVAFGGATLNPSAKVQVDQSATTGGAMIINKPNATNTANGVNVISANTSNTGWGNSSVFSQRGNVTANTYLYAGGASATSITGVSSNGIGIQGTSENGFGMVGLAFNGIGVRGYNLNSGNAGYFENLLNAGNTQPVVFVNSIASSGNVYGLQSIMENTSPGGYSTALRGQHNSTTGNGIGVWGSQNGNGWGVHGTTINGIGMYGNISNGTGGTGIGIWGESFGAGAFSGGVFRGLSGSYYGSFSDNNNPAGFAAVLGYQNHLNPTNAGSSAIWGLNLATNGVGYGGQFSHASSGTGVYGVAGTNGTGVQGTSSGTGSVGVQGNSNLGFAGFFETSSTTNTNATLRVNDPNLTGGTTFRKSGIYSEVIPLAGSTSMLAATSAIKGVATVSLSPGTGGGAGVQGVSRSGYGVVGNTTDGVGLLGVSWGGTGYALQTSGKVQIMGQGAALNRVLASDAVGNATWQDLAAIGGVSGSGTFNYVSKWTPDGTTLGVSQLFDNGVSVGIGTTTPSAAVLMDMRGTQAQLRLVDNDQASQVWLSAPGLGYTGGIGTLSNHDFPIFTNLADRMTIKANGRVGVNTVNPAGTMEIFQNSVVGTPHLVLNENGDDYGRLTLRNTNANNSGNNFWDIAGYTNDTRAFERLNFYNAANGDLMTLTGDGRVGIGINASYPFAKLHVNSATDFNTSLLEAQDVDNVGPHQYYYSGGQYGIIDYIRTDYSVPGFLSRRGALEVRGVSRLNLHATNSINYNNGMTLLGNGLVGVGTDNPLYKFHVASNVAVAFVHDLDQATAVALVAPGLGYTGGAGTFTGQDFPLFTNNVDRLTVKPNGDVGIATSTPVSRLHLISRPDSRAIHSESSFTTAAGIFDDRVANYFEAVNVNEGVVSRTGDFQNTNLPPLYTSILGIDSSNAVIGFGVTGYAVSNTTGNSGVYGYGSMNANPNVTGYVTGSHGGTFWGGDNGANVGVWSTLPGLGSNGFNPDKKGLNVYVATAAHPNTNYGVYVQNVSGGATNYAGYFNGNVHVNGNFSATGVKAFRIDHPLDPQNKYLVHAAVESPEMMNLYSGNVKTDENGRAWVELPSYFEAANKEFKYQLTIIDETQFAMARVSKKISGNRFEIMTDKPGIEVSWQVTGVRNDPAADKYRFSAEVEKKGNEKGKYLEPEVYNQAANKGIHFTESPDINDRNAKAQYVPVKVVEPEQKKIPGSALEMDPAEEQKTRAGLEKTWLKGQNQSLPTQNNSSADGIKVERKKSVMTDEDLPVEERNKAGVQPTRKAIVPPAAETIQPASPLTSVTLSQEEINEENRRSEQKKARQDVKIETVPQAPVNATKGQEQEKPAETKTVDPGGKMEKQASKTE